MPNRIIKESICSSESLDKLTPFQETFFYRRIVNCDDFGRMDARPPVLKSKLFPLRDKMQLREIEKAVAALVSVGCIVVYEVDGNPYLYFPDMANHQSIRAKKSKYPIALKRMTTSEIICNQTDANVPVFVFENRIRESNSNICAEPDKSAPAPEPVLTLALNDKSEYPIYGPQIAEWEALYPAVDVMQELRAMKGWLNANPTKRKTKTGISRFVNGWLAKEQNGGGTRASPKEGANYYGDLL